MMFHVQCSSFWLVVVVLNVFVVLFFFGNLEFDV